MKTVKHFLAVGFLLCVFTTISLADTFNLSGSGTGDHGDTVTFSGTGTGSFLAPGKVGRQA